MNEPDNKPIDLDVLAKSILSEMLKVISHSSGWREYVFKVKVECEVHPGGRRLGQVVICIDSVIPIEAPKPQPIPLPQAPSTDSVN